MNITAAPKETAHRVLACCEVPSSLLVQARQIGVAADGARLHVLRDTRSHYFGDGLLVMDIRTDKTSSFARVEVIGGTLPDCDEAVQGIWLRLSDAETELPLGRIALLPLDPEDRRKQIPEGTKEPTWNWTLESRAKLGGSQAHQTVVAILRAGECVRLKRTTQEEEVTLEQKSSLEQ